MCGEKAFRIAPDASVLGITPACAGKSRGDAVYNWRKRDHPRVCGEKCGSGTLGAACAGSPPRVRGKAVRCPCVIRGRRITPACAGKSLRVERLHKLTGDHPRVCGEKHGAKLAAYRKMGSPPRVRGKENISNRSFYAIGITPACAGKRLSHPAPHRARRDHPRVCGEKFRLHMASTRRWGSPPRVRGKD